MTGTTEHVLLNLQHNLKGKWKDSLKTKSLQ